MTIDEIREKLVHLQQEYTNNPEILKEIAGDISVIIDESMERNFSAHWNADKKRYEQ